MKRILTLISSLVLTLSLAASGSEQDKSYLECNRYFGEKPPGLIPKLFDPKIVSPEGSFEGGAFTPDMKEFYFTRKNGKYKKRTFFVLRKDKNQWGPESETDIRWPEFSADGKVMYVGKNYRERTASGWSDAKSPGEFIEKMAHGRSVSASGTYYYTVYEDADPDIGAIYFSHLIDGKYEEPIKMNDGINNGKFIAHPYIAPDESYLIWDMRRADGYGQADMYISFKQEDGGWSPAVNMGPSINTKMQESSPRVTHDGKYLFFTRGEWKLKPDGTRNYVGKRYWVDAKVIKKLKQQSINN